MCGPGLSRRAGANFHLSPPAPAAAGSNVGSGRASISARAEASSRSEKRTRKAREELTNTRTPRMSSACGHAMLVVLKRNPTASGADVSAGAHDSRDRAEARLFTKGTIA